MNCPSCGNPMIEGALVDGRDARACLCGNFVFTTPALPPHRHGEAPEQPKGTSRRPAPDLEQMYADILAEHCPDLPKALRHQELVPGRKFTTDFCWPAARVAVEIEGACHRTKTRFFSDAEKQNLLATDGWTVLRFTGRMLRGQIEQVVEWTRAALFHRKASLK